ncbi:MAG: hypothetical protein HYU60_07240 [Magnetospirillum sp.]|nr:hypothetical protein [Magnetospirillum sp.]
MDGASGCRGSTRCHELAAVVTNVVMTLARERAESGFISVVDLERIAALVRRGTISLDDAFRHHEEACRRDHTRPKGDVGARSNPFQRLMVRPFEQMLVGDPAAFPRHYLPNYFGFLGQAFGARLEPFESHSRAIVQALLVVHGNNLTWDHFYADQRTVKTLKSALKLMTHVLGSAEGQRLWHASLVRPVDAYPAPTIPQANQVRLALLETGRGLAAEGG